MKFRLLYFATLVISIAGCDKIKDAATISINTQLKADIPVLVTAAMVKSSDLITPGAPIIFNKTQELKIEDNVDLAPYLAKIKEIDLTSLVVTVSGLTTGQTINSVSVDITGIGTLFTQTNITMTNNTFTPVIQSGMLDMISAKLLAEKKITITVSGSASGPLSIVVGLNMNAKVVAFLLK